ncbi:MAG: hypothetical protein Q4P05_03945 [Actinomycetaceae bacterium]|nr:hypothetical protein [Actinomycetaceae bacterium]
MERKAKLIALLAMIYVSTVVISLAFVAGTGTGNLLANDSVLSTFDADRIHRVQAITQYGSWGAVAIILFATWRLLLKYDLYGSAIRLVTVASALILGISLGLLLGFLFFPTGTLMWQPVVSGVLTVLAATGVVIVFSRYAVDPNTL